MAALEKTHGYWYATFRVNACKGAGLMMPTTKRVTITKTQWDHDSVPYFWCMIDGVGTWPGTDSPDWIEYIPAPSCPGCGPDENASCWICRS